MESGRLSAALVPRPVLESNTMAPDTRRPTRRRRVLRRVKPTDRRSSKPAAPGQVRSRYRQPCGSQHEIDRTEGTQRSLGNDLSSRRRLLCHPPFLVTDVRRGWYTIFSFQIHEPLTVVPCCGPRGQSPRSRASTLPLARAGRPIVCVITDGLRRAFVPFVHALAAAFGSGVLPEIRRAAIA